MDTLGNQGNSATSFLFDALHSASGLVKLGAIKALSTIRDLPTIESLIRTFQEDPVTEVWCVASLALGESGFPVAISVIV
ncbi:MAG: HEAT repeat domain-containing protein, partial [Methanomicrobiales archaeon]